MNVPAPSEKICRSNGYTCFIEQLSGIHQGPVLYYGGVTGAGKEIVPDSIIDLPVTIGKMAKTGYSYLSKIAAKLQKKGIQVTVAVLIGDVAEEITRFAKDEEADLIVMASGGKKTLKRWDVGNAAEKVVCWSNPVALVHQEKSWNPLFVPNRKAVPPLKFRLYLLPSQT